jgi:hypothetical protein
MAEAWLPPHQSRIQGEKLGVRFRELHLYHGPRCNRACDFCTVSGSPDGWYAAFTPAVLDRALALVERDGNLKIYGGEPTLDLLSLTVAIRYLRRGGFVGWVTLFSNGVLAERVIELLEADAQTEVVLNYSIATGVGAEPLPAKARRALERYALRRPGVLFLSHPDLVPVGRGAAAAWADRGTFGGVCPRCCPVLTSRGQLHACPFAVELDLPQYDLGGLESDPDAAPARHRQFLGWIDSVIQPEAERQGRHPCQICTTRRVVLSEAHHEG